MISEIVPFLLGMSGSFFAGWQVLKKLMCKKYILKKSCYLAAAFIKFTTKTPYHEF
jgi:hypothetical protein